MGVSSKWKAYERSIAKKLGGERTTNSRQSQDQGIGDITLSPYLYIEVKDHKDIKVGYNWKKVSNRAKIYSKIPVLIFKSPVRGEGPLLLIRLKDLGVVSNEILRRD